MKKLTHNEKVISILIFLFGIILIAQGMSYELPPPSRYDLPSNRELFTGFGLMCLAGSSLFIQSIKTARK